MMDRLQNDGADGNRWWALLLLTAIYTFHAVDRSVVNIVIEPMKSEFALSDGAVGFLGGLAHAIGYAATVIPLGMLADRVNRVRLLGALVTIWSGLTVFGGFAPSFTALALCRVGVGAAEGGGSPACLSLIADYFPKRQRGMAFGIFYSSTALGVFLIFLFGGMIASAYGWRAVFFAAGGPGLVLALLVQMTLRQPRRGRFDEPSEMQPPPRLREVLLHIGRSPPLAFSILGLTLAIVVVSGVWAWASSFFIRIHGLDIREAGFTLAIALGVVQGVFLPIVGRLNDWLSAGRPDRIHALSVAGMLASIPIGAVMVLAPSVQWSIVAAMLLGASTASWLGQSFGAIVMLTPANMRGSVFGLAQLGTNLIGTGFGPLLVGTISDAYGGGASLRYSLLTMLMVYAAAATSLMAVNRMLRACPEPVGI